MVLPDTPDAASFQPCTADIRVRKMLPMNFPILLITEQIRRGCHDNAPGDE